MPALLILAFAASLGLHAMALLVPELDLSPAGEPPPLQAELRPAATTAPPAETPVQPATRTAVVVRKVRPKPAARPPPPVVPDASLALPAGDAGSSADAASGSAPTVDEAATLTPPAESPAGQASAAVQASLPSRGVIHYRVDRGDQNFQIGRATHQWEVVDGVYRITAVTETSGLIGLFRPLRVEVESSGRLTEAGLLPERFMTRNPGRRGSEEQADFDWPQMQLHMTDQPVQALSPGAQDLLSLYYQLGLIADLKSGQELSVVTGRKYMHFRLEVVGEEEVDTPAGSFHCLHLRVPGVASTELWLAHERAMLPVKLKYIDRKGGLYIQLATAIELSQEP